MSGTLFYAMRFEESHYVGTDGHFEVEPVDGDLSSLTHSSWNEVVRYFSALGVPADGWPVYESYIDTPLADMRTKNNALRAHLQRISELPEDAPFWAKFVYTAVEKGQLVFFTHE